MRSYVVVTVEGGLVQDVSVWQGNEPGVVEPTVIDWDLPESDPVEALGVLAGYEAEAIGLPVDWIVRANILAEVAEQRQGFYAGVDRGEA